MLLRNPGRRVTALLCVLAVFGVAAGACTDPTGGTGDKVTLRFNAWSSSLTWEVAAEQGFFDKFGVNVELVFLTTAAANPAHLAVTEDLADGRPDDVQVLVNAWFSTLGWIRENTDPAVEITAKRIGVTPDQASRIADFLVDNGLVEDRSSLDGLFDDRSVEAAPR